MYVNFFYYFYYLLYYVNFERKLYNIMIINVLFLFFFFLSSFFYLLYEYLVKYYVKKQDNTFLSVPGNNYPVGGISSPNLNENHITNENDNTKTVITTNTIGSPLTSVMQTINDDYANF